MKPLLSIVIVTHNHQRYIDKCLSSVEKYSKTITSEVIIVDNQSSDHTRGIISNKLKKTDGHLIHNRRNLGFARAINQGLRQASGKYVLILNPDTMLLPKSLSTLVSYFNQHPDINCLIPQLVNPDGSVQRSVRLFPSITTFLIRRTLLRKIKISWIQKHNMEHLSAISYKHIEPITWALGAAIFMRKSLLKINGYFDEHFFLYCEDIDWFYRLHKNRETAFYFPYSKIVHYHLAVSDKYFLSRESLLHIVSMMLYFRKYWREVITGNYKL